MKHVSAKFVVRKDYKSPTGQTTVYLRISHENRQQRFALPLLVTLKHWDESKQRVSKHEYEHWDKNKLLDFYDAQAKTYIAECQIKKKAFSTEELKAMLFGKVASDDYVEFVKSEIEGDITLSKETKRTYYAKLNKLSRFQGKISLSEMDYNFLMAYKNWMIASGNEENTYNKDLAIIKSFLNRVIKKGLIERHDFDKIKIRNVGGKREFLTMSELQALRKLHEAGTLNERLQKTLRMFLFTCYTGLRYQDLKALTYEHINNNFIVLKMHKTHKTIDIPLIDEAKKLLPQERKNDSEAVFNVYSNQVFNRYIKELAEIAGIDKDISHHCARHTFATLALDNGMKLEVISKILGHSSLRVTLIYAKIMQQQKVESMAAFNQCLAATGA